MNEGTLRVRNWRACKRLFFSRRPHPVRCFETVTGVEGAGVGSLAVLTKSAAVPRDPVAAFFLLAGADRRATCNGWVTPAGEPALATEEDMAESWAALRTGIEAGRYRLDPLEGSAVEKRAAYVCEVLDWSSDPERPGQLRLTPWPRGRMVVDGRTAAAEPVWVAIDLPWQRGLSVRDAWNDQIFVGETAERFVLITWSTGA